MRKVIVGFVSNSLMVIIPLLAKPELLRDFRIWIILAGGFFIWLTQPVFSVQETKDNKQSDNFSVVLILVCSLISVVAPVVEWAYFSNTAHHVPPIVLAGTLIMITGLLIRAWAVRTLGRLFTPTVQIRNKHKLVTEGPYRFMRHPSYTGAYLAIVAPAIILESWYGTLIAIIAMAIAYVVRIRVEERALVAFFGDEYRDYKSRTKMLIPYIW